MSPQLKFVMLPLLAILSAFPAAARDEREHQNRDPVFGNDNRRPPPRPPAPAAAPDAVRWILLGEQTVGFNVDHDTIPVGIQQGAFLRLKIQARTNDIFLYAVRVAFANGGQQIVAMNRLVQAGGPAANFALKGDRQHAIRLIALNYKARPGFSGQTVVSVYGSQAVAPKVEVAQPPAAAPHDDDDDDDNYASSEPQVIDQQTYDRRSDRVDFHVARRDLRLKDLSLRAVDDSLSLESMEIRFSSGPPQTVNIYDRLMPGDVSRPVEIDTDRRTVTGVTVIKRPSWRPGDGRLELLGRAARDERSAHHAPMEIEQGRGPSGWVLFGTQTVGNDVDRDVIDIPQDIGRFRHIALSIRDAEVYLRQITLVYADGQRETKDIYTSIQANSRTAPIDINSNRFLRQIELVYQSRLERRPTRAVVEVYGEYDRRWLDDDRDGYRGYNRGWLLIGAQRTKMFAADEDAFVIGPKFGTFKNMRLTAKRQTVRITGVRVTYVNGQSEDLPLFKELSDGQSTDNIELGHPNLAVDRVDVRYRTKLTFQGEGLVELWATR